MSRQPSSSMLSKWWEAVANFALDRRHSVSIVEAIAATAMASGSAVAVVLWCVKPQLPQAESTILAVVFLTPALLFLLVHPFYSRFQPGSKAEKAPAAGGALLRKVLDAVPFGVCIVEPGLRIRFTNTALLKEFGPVEGRTCREYFPGSPDSCTGCEFTGPVEGKGLLWEAVSQQSGKVYEIYETSLQGEETISKLAVVRDITAQKEAEHKLRTSRQRLRSLSVHQQRTREEERTAISREIHDELGQVLATVQLGVSSLADEYPDHRQLTAKVEGMKQLLASAIKTVHRISTQLRPAVLDDLGLEEAIQWQAKEFSKRTGIACTADILLQETVISQEAATAFFRICQEGLTNVLRHAKATRVAVSLEQRNNRIVLIVADNGSGITFDQIHNAQSLGITGMRERAYALGGKVRLCRSRHGGTVLIAQIPMNRCGIER